jgi:hypothetical protein
LRRYLAACIAKEKEKKRLARERKSDPV